VFKKNDKTFTNENRRTAWVKNETNRTNKEVCVQDNPADPCKGHAGG